MAESAGTGHRQVVHSFIWVCGSSWCGCSMTGIKVCSAGMDERKRVFVKWGEGDLTWDELHQRRGSLKTSLERDGLNKMSTFLTPYNFAFELRLNSKYLLSQPICQETIHHTQAFKELHIRNIQTSKIVNWTSELSCQQTLCWIHTIILPARTLHFMTTLSHTKEKPSHHFCQTSSTFCYLAPDPLSL